MTERNWFDEDVAASYDTGAAAVDGAQLDRLVALAAGRPALELAIGTGRVALPFGAGSRSQVSAWEKPPA